METIHRASLLKFAAMAAVAFSSMTSAHANPVIDGFITLQTVVITASPSFSNIYDETSTPSYGAVIASPLFRNVRLNADIYYDYLDFVAAAKLNPLTSPDVRCNRNASDHSKMTTSRSDLTERWLAAYQVFSVIKLANSAASIRALLRDSPAYLYAGAMEFTFRITYADGGSELWVVQSTPTPTLVSEGNVPNSLIKRDGIVKSCPLTIGG